MTPDTPSFQTRVHLWMCATFPSKVIDSKEERAMRFLEESLELVQALGLTQAQALAVAMHVFGRPVGYVSQEIGGVMVTLAALCHTADDDMRLSGERELARVWTKIGMIRAKHEAKPAYIKAADAR